MGTIKGITFENVYQAYLNWFKGRGEEFSRPKEMEELLKFQITNEDVFEGPTVLLNRVYFSVPIFPGESRQGKFEYFNFSELNLMLKSRHTDGGEITNVIPAEYRIE